MDVPPDFLCPISMELMKDPVTIATGLSYERKNIEKWFFTYKKKTCPATMQSLKNFDATPNHNLKRLILAWQNQNKASQSCSSSSSSSPSVKHDDMLSLLKTIESSPFKVSSLKKLRSIIEIGDEIINTDFILSSGVEVLVQIIVQILYESHDFVTFRACEEALGVLQQLPLSEEERTFELLSKQESIKSMAIMLQRGSAEGRLYTITIFQKMSKSNYDWNFVIQDQGIDFFKSLLELVSDEICTKASSRALDVLIDILGGSKKSRLKAIEAGAVCVLIELLPDSNRSSKCEKVLVLLKILCECAEGRQALVEHGMAIAAISKKMLHVSNTTTKIAVKILWLICSLHPTDIVLEEMLVYGSVKKLLALLHIDGRSSTKDKVLKMFKLHGNLWKRYPCFPCEMKEYLALADDSR